MKPTKTEHQEAIAKLKETLKPGDTVHTVLRHVSKSGMSRRIDLFKIENGEPRYLTYLVAKATGYSMPDKGNGLIASGCGMDMGFAVVYDLARTLWPKGDGKTVTGRNGDKNPENDGGYLLKQRWL